MRNAIATLIASAMALALMTAPALADAPTTGTDSVTFVDLNPCTGELHDVTLLAEVSIHEHRNNTVVQADITVTTSDGFEGSGHDRFVLNGNVATATHNFVLDNPDTGAKFTVKGHFTFDINQGELRTERFVFNCVKDA